MTHLELKDLIETGREIEFIYNDKRYSITYYGDDREDYISFCEFYKEPVDVKNIEELLKIQINNVDLKEVLSNLENKYIWIF